MATIYRRIIHDGPNLSIDMTVTAAAPDTNDIGWTASGNLSGEWFGIVGVEWQGDKHAQGEGFPVTWEFAATASCAGLVTTAATGWIEGTGGTAHFEATIPIVWMQEVIVPDLDGPPSGYLASGNPSREIWVTPHVDTRAGETYSITVTATVGETTETYTASGNTADDFTPFADIGLYLKYYALPAEHLITNPTVTNGAWANMGDVIAELEAHSSTDYTVWGFSPGLNYYHNGHQVLGLSTGVQILTAQDYGSIEYEGRSSVQGDYGITGSVYCGDELQSGDVDYEDISNPSEDPELIAGTASFSDHLPSHVTYWKQWTDVEPAGYESVYNDTHHAFGSRFDAFYYQVVLADTDASDPSLYSNWPASKGYDSTDRALFLREDDELWENVLTFAQASTYTIESWAGATVEGWDSCTGCTSSLDTGALKIVTTAADAQCERDDAEYIIRHRRALRIRLKGPAGALTFGMTIGGVSKTWTITLAVANTYEEHLLDLLLPNEGVWPGPCAPRHDAHDGSGYPTNTAYTLGFYDLADDSTYYIDWIKEEQLAGGTHQAQMRFRTPSDWMWDRKIGSGLPPVYTHVYYGRIVDLLSQGIGAPRHWFVDGIDNGQDGDTSREVHYGIGAEKADDEIDDPSYTYTTLAAFITDGNSTMGVRPLSDISGLGYTVTEVEPSPIWYDESYTEVDYNDLCLSCWTIEEFNIDVTSSHTFKCAVQGERWLLVCGYPHAIDLSFVKFYGGQFEGAVMKTTPAEGNCGSPGAVLQATCAAESETSATWNGDSVGAHLGPSVGVVAYSREYNVYETASAPDVLLGTRDGITRACVRVTGEADVPVGSVSHDIDRSLDSRIYQAWSNGSTVSIRWTGGGTYDWVEHTVGSGGRVSLYQDDSRTDAAIFLAHESSTDIVLKSSVDSGVSWTTIVSIFTSASCPHIRKDKAMNLCLGFAWKAASGGSIVMRRSCDDWTNFLEAEYTIITGVPEQTVSLSFKGDINGTYALSVVDGAGAVDVYESVDNGLTWAAI